MALAITGTGNGSLNNLALSGSTGDILDSANSTFFGADWYVMTANHTTNGGKLTNWQNSLANSGKIGTGMSESSGIWTFPNTGVWWIYLTFRIENQAVINSFSAIEIYTTPDNSTYTQAARGGTLVDDEGHTTQVTLPFMFDVQDVSNYKFYFEAQINDAGNYILGSTTNVHTAAGFIRLGDT